MPSFSEKLRSLWRCTSGQVVSSELILFATVALFGLLVVFSSVRDSVISEFNDSVLAVQNSNQDFSYNGLVGPSSSTPGSDYIDALDVADGEDLAGEVRGISFSALPTNEEDLADLNAILESLDYTYQMTRGNTWTGTASFAGGVYTPSQYWPGTYTISGNIITIALNAIGGSWSGGEIILDASDPENITGNVSWTNVSGFVWSAVYNLFGM